MPVHPIRPITHAVIWTMHRNIMAKNGQTEYITWNTNKCAMSKIVIIMAARGIYRARHIEATLMPRCALEYSIGIVVLNRIASVKFNIASVKLTVGDWQLTPILCIESSQVATCSWTKNAVKNIKQIINHLSEIGKNIWHRLIFEERFENSKPIPDSPKVPNPNKFAQPCLYYLD